MARIHRIAELPLRERDALDLLHLRVHRDVPDPDYTGYGFARVDAIRLESRDGSAPIVVRDGLLVAVHSTEAPAPLPLPGDIELEFVIAEPASDPAGEYSVTVLLSAFLDHWLPRLGDGERPVVLVVCNPNRTSLVRPRSAGRAPFHHPLGDVESWLEVERGRRWPCLVADAWRLAEAEMDTNSQEERAHAHTNVHVQAQR